MSQAPITLPNTGTLAGVDAVNDINAALATLNTGWLGTTAPTSPAQGQMWYDSSVSNRLIEKRYDGTSWLLTGNVYDTSGHLVYRRVGGGVNSLASAATCDLGSLNESGINITGTTGISSFGASAQVGEVKFVTLGGAILLTYNATSLILPGSANINGSAGDTLIAEALGSGNWRVISYAGAGGTSAVTASSINGGQIAGFRNRIINGAFQIDQRNSGASQTFTAAAVLAYTVDRFYGYCTGANITGQQLSTVLGHYRFTGAASNTGVGFGTRLEAANTADLAGQNATLSVKLSSSSLTAIGWAAYYATTTDSFGTLAAPTRTLIASGTFNINSTEAIYSANIAMAAGATTGVEIVFTGGALLAAQTLTIGEVQLENGSQATPFERRPLQTETSLCQRYYEFSAQATIRQGTKTATGNASTAWADFKVTKRIIPTVTHTTTGSVGTQNTAAYMDCFVVTAGGSPGDLAAFTTWTASAEL